MPSNQVLYHVTSPFGALSIAKSGVYIPTSLDRLNGDAGLNMVLAKHAGDPATTLREQIAENTGACLVLEWDGPSKNLLSWGDGPEPDVLYHQSWSLGASSDPENDPNDYWRSFVPLGTHAGLRITGFAVDYRRVKQDWINKELPDAVMSGWRFAPRIIRRLVAPYGNRVYLRHLDRIIRDSGQSSRRLTVQESD